MNSGRPVGAKGEAIAAPFAHRVTGSRRFPLWKRLSLC